MIKAVFFDYDGVLTPHKTGSFTIVDYISRVTGIDIDAFSEVYKKYNKDLLYGKTTHEKIWKSLCEALKTDINIKHLYDSFIYTPINELVFDLIRNFKKKYKTGMITDNKVGRIHAVTEKQKLHDLLNNSNTVSLNHSDVFIKAIQNKLGMMSI